MNFSMLPVFSPGGKSMPPWWRLPPKTALVLRRPSLSSRLLVLGEARPP